MSNNIIKTTRIKEIFEECEGIKTIVFNMKDLDRANYIMPKPGQFVMVWVPGIDEIPMSISGCNDYGDWFITVKSIGECSNALSELKKGDYFGIRGPLGNFFKFPYDNSKISILVGGGIGIAPLKFLAFELMKHKHEIKIIEGAKVNSELIYLKDFKMLEKRNSELFYCTDDGSLGYKGYASQYFDKILKEQPRSNLSNCNIFTCGPEKMVYEIFQICEKYHINVQVSLERVMRCGCGLCGLCAVDPLGLLVCKEGPVFDSKILRQLDDFGKYKRDFTGKKVPLD
ncbi:MAG: dihydroorotate dehydrogenase electron transfer subunit [Promethearchaeota archaeon]